MQFWLNERYLHNIQYNCYDDKKFVKNQLKYKIFNSLSNILSSILFIGYYWYYFLYNCHDLQKNKIYYIKNSMMNTGSIMYKINKTNFNVNHIIYKIINIFRDLSLLIYLKNNIKVYQINDFYIKINNLLFYFFIKKSKLYFNNIKYTKNINIYLYHLKYKLIYQFIL